MSSQVTTADASVWGGGRSPYATNSTRPMTRTEYWLNPAYMEMRDKFAMKGWCDEEDRESVLWFDLVATDFYAEWKGKLIIEWSPPELSWWRRAHRNVFPILAIREETALDPEMPNWRNIELEWGELGVLSPTWRAKLSEWRGVYYIFDASDGKGYVGSAYGADNLLGRWLSYSSSGHGGNRLLKSRDPRNFRFTILERVGPDKEAEEVIIREQSWKKRLHTAAPCGLNDN